MFRNLLSGAISPLRRTALGFLLTLLAGAAHAQQPVVRGTVADRTTGEPLLGATVRLAGPGSAGAGTATDLDGAFALP